MRRVVEDVAAGMGAPMAGDDLGAERDLDPVDIALSRSKIRCALCRCLRGTSGSVSASRIASTIPVNPSSLVRLTGFVRRYPGGAE